MWSLSPRYFKRAAAAQLQDHLLYSNGLHGKLQAAYRKNHSTETALLRAQNDILRGIDSQKTLCSSILISRPPLTPSIIRFFSSGWGITLEFATLPVRHRVQKTGKSRSLKKFGYTQDNALLLSASRLPWVLHLNTPFPWCKILYIDT